MILFKVTDRFTNFLEFHFSISSHNSPFLFHLFGVKNKHRHDVMLQVKFVLSFLFLFLIWWWWWVICVRLKSEFSPQAILYDIVRSVVRGTRTVPIPFNFSFSLIIIFTTLYNRNTCNIQLCMWAFFFYFFFVVFAFAIWHEVKTVKINKHSMVNTPVRHTNTNTQRNTYSDTTYTTMAIANTIELTTLWKVCICSNCCNSLAPFR